MFLPGPLIAEAVLACSARTAARLKPHLSEAAESSSKAVHWAAKAIFSLKRNR